MIVREANETEEQFLWRIGQLKDNGSLDMSWEEIAAVMNKEFRDDVSEYRSEAAYRKPYQQAKRFFDAGIFNRLGEDEYINSLREAKRDLEKERKKIQTENLEYNRYLRETARDELICEKICESISRLPKLDVPEYIEPIKNNKSYLLAFGDLHDGITFEIKDFFGNIINSYSPQILENRMWDMFAQVVSLIKEKNISELNIYNLGDNTQGILRLTSQLQKLRLGVVDSTMHCANLLANFLNELSKYTRINYQMVDDSNHDQLRLCSDKKNAFPEENMGKIIKWHLKEVLKDNPNINILENPTGMNYGVFSTYSVVGVHGEEKNLAKSINEFSRIYNIPINYVIGAHKHHILSEENGMKSEAVSIRSIIGVDPYGMSLKKASDAGASLLTFEQSKGLVCEDRIILT